MTNDQEKRIQSASVPVSAVQSDIFNPVRWEQMKGMAETFIASKALPDTENAAKLVMKMQAGYEMGMKPLESIRSFYFVKGTLNIFGAAVIRRLREHGWTIKFDESVPNKCTAIIFHKDTKEKITDSFTYEEAEKSGWTKDYANKQKPGWYEGANRNLKLRYGVISKIIKTYVPEVMGSAVDITEVAEDTTPIFSDKQIEGIKAQLLPDGDVPATDAQLGIIISMGGVIPEDGEMTKQQAVDTIAELTRNKQAEITSKKSSKEEVQEGEVIKEEVKNE